MLSPHFLTESSLTCVPGVFTGTIIRMISDIRANGGEVDLNSCGKFTLAEDLSDISDMMRIDLSEIDSLEGGPRNYLEFSFAQQPAISSPSMEPGTWSC